MKLGSKCYKLPVKPEKKMKKKYRIAGRADANNTSVNDAVAADYQSWIEFSY